MPEMLRRNKLNERLIAGPDATAGVNGMDAPRFWHGDGTVKLELAGQAG